MDEVMNQRDRMNKAENEGRTMNKEDTKKTIAIDPNILIDCIDYTNAVVDGYVAIYKNFQKILWTMRQRGVSEADAAAATVGIVNRAAAKAQSMVPHKNPFEKLEDLEKTDDDDDKREETSNEDAQN